MATVLFVAAAVSGCAGVDSGGAAGLQRPAALVRVSPAQARAISVSSIYTATARSRHSVSLSPQVDGQVAKIFVQAGDSVRPGTPLMEISPERQQASVNSFASAIDSAKQDLASAQETLHSLESQRAGKLSNLKLAAEYKESYAQLRAQGAVSTMDLEQRQNAYEAAKADLDSIDAQIRSQNAVIKRILRQIQQSEHNLRQQQVQLQYYTIKAPFAGVVGDIPVRLGSYVNTSTVLTTVTENRPLEIYVEVPVERTHELRIGQLVELLDPKDEVIGVSHVFFIAPSVSADSQTVLAKATFDNSKGELRADQVVKARVIWSTQPGVTVPTEAVTHQSGQDFLFLAEGNGQATVARQVPVKLGDIQGATYQVLKGIKPGDRVIVSGVQNLADKMPVTVAQ